jgi:hypothetical protein
MNMIVLGGGISGLITCFYNPRATLVRDSSSHMSNPFVFIQKNKHTDKLLSDIECSAPIISVRVDNDIVQENVVSGKINSFCDREYIGTDIVANVGKNDILPVYCMSEQDLCEKIERKISNQIIDDKAVSILQDFVCLENGSLLAYDRLISTIHFKQFAEICPSWEPGDKIRACDFYYRIDRDSSVKRDCITYFSGRNDKIIKRVENRIVGGLGTEYSCLVEGSLLMKDGRVSGTLNPAPDKVLFSGRFATGNSHWRVEDSIFIADKGMVLAEMLEEQKRCDALIKRKSPMSKDERVNKLILHIHSELSELLRETNWKMNIRKKKLPRATSILEEIIDVLKLAMAISLEYDYTPREIVDMFWGKSEQVWDRLIEEFYGGV